jgi:LEA14-like dessication related protein
MPLEKKTRTIIIVGILVMLVGGASSFGGLYYSAVTQIEIDVDKIYITRIGYGGILLNPTIDLDLEIHTLISNPTIMPVTIEYAQFEIYLEDVFYGNGQTSSFKAIREPSALTIDVFLVNIGGLMHLELLDLIILGNSKTMTIRITTVKVVGLTIELNQDINVVVAQEDIVLI